ncbi:hypothetical protein SAMN05216350_11618 [Polaromonas sp. YR568]|uniref:hypothetical protein n=1 Tax=Polaromonas sp. YR568 TaxID=1855301 RepID=UPI0008F3A718|nr:hypothetical protein [Polaromonas sp. YR568]SFV03245.1 hypothetical protein SAMN05216350_11618 [Polaromonas sp. YR568]
MQHFFQTLPDFFRRPAPEGAPPDGTRSDIFDGIKQGVLWGVALAVVILPIFRAHQLRPVYDVHAVQAAALQQTPRTADFGGETASENARQVANWVVTSGDNRKLFFVILDKANTKVFVFEPSGKLRSATPVLIGAARGDDSVDGIGGRPIAQVLPEERTTPAGRFLGEPGRNATGEDVVWVDYDAAVSMHRVRTLEPKERRLERLASPTTDDNRISYGCINMPVAFFENVLKPAFNASYGVVYVLPEVKSLAEVFPGAHALALRQRGAV